MVWTNFPKANFSILKFLNFIVFFLKGTYALYETTAHMSWQVEGFGRWTMVGRKNNKNYQNVKNTLFRIFIHLENFADFSGCLELKGLEVNGSKADKACWWHKDDINVWMPHEIYFVADKIYGKWIYKNIK